VETAKRKSDSLKEGLAPVVCGVRLQQLCRLVGMGPAAPDAWAARSSHPVASLSMYVVARGVYVPLIAFIFILGAPHHLEYVVPAALLLASLIALTVRIWRIGPVEAKTQAVAVAEVTSFVIFAYLTATPYLRSQTNMPFGSRYWYTVTVAILYGCDISFMQNSHAPRTPERWARTPRSMLIATASETLKYMEVNTAAGHCPVTPKPLSVGLPVAPQHEVRFDAALPAAFSYAVASHVLVLALILQSVLSSMGVIMT
jgi:hypothetical protein